jgi:ferric-dicitrate binding protein FerR (iron transport regulator)
MKREHDDLNADDDIGALLRQVGARHEPASAAVEEVRRAVHDEWRAIVAQRKRRNRVVAFGIAASIALVMVVASWALRFDAPAERPVTVARIDGEAQFQTSPADPVRAINVGDSLAVGAVLTTDDATRIALAYGAGASMRIDRSSRLQRISPDRFRLSAGAVYVDASPQSEDHELVIETLAGEVRHLGTQYQIRQASDAVEVSIREGRVEIASFNGAALVSAGERLRIDAAGQVERSAISAQDPAWDWAETTSPSFPIDDRTLAEFLDWAARETGRHVVYASSKAQRMAETVKLRGSIEGLHPDAAVSAVLSTTEFTQYDSGDESIGVQLATIEGEHP